jgi:hypothetical protein
LSGAATTDVVDEGMVTFSTAALATPAPPNSSAPLIETTAIDFRMTLS